MADKNFCDFYCDIEEIDRLSKLISNKTDELQETYVSFINSLNYVKENKLLEGKYFEAFLTEFDVIDEWYNRYIAQLMTININLGNIYYNTETLISIRNELENYL